MRYVQLMFWLVASVAFVSELKAEEFQLQGVPFKTQSPPGDWQNNMNCGPTAALMLASYYQGVEPTTAKLTALLDWLYARGIIVPQEGAEYYDGNVTGIRQLERILLEYFDVGQIIRQNKKDFDFLRQQLLKQNPIIVGVNLNMNASQFGHFMVLVGLTETEVVVHDPGKTLGAYRKYSRASFISSWATSNYATLVVRANGPLWYPSGTLVQPVGSNRVYVTSNEGLLWIKDEAVFNAMSFDWQKIIPVHPRLLQCLPKIAMVDWQPYREVWQIGNTYYLFEKTSQFASDCALYPFASKTALDSWNLHRTVQKITSLPSSAQSCYRGNTLYLKDGVLVKATSSFRGYSAGTVFVATDNGELRPFVDWDTFVMMGYENLPILSLSVTAIISAYTELGALITSAEAYSCRLGNYVIQGGEQPAVRDDDSDSFSTQAGDCNDANSAVFPGASEICDNEDNDCDGEVDEQANCSSGFFCEHGICQAVESDEIRCRILCPSGMLAYAWWGEAGFDFGPEVSISLTEENLCERGAAWFDFNCACDANWSCHSWTSAEVTCNRPVDVHSGHIDPAGEGEVWFTEVECD